jgi:hypothetical protein
MTKISKIPKPRKRFKLPPLPMNSVYKHPTDPWIVRKTSPETFQLWFSEGAKWEDTQHGNFVSCKAAITFAEAL